MEHELPRNGLQPIAEIVSVLLIRIERHRLERRQHANPKE